MTILLFDLSGQAHILLAVLRSLRHSPGTQVHLLAEHRMQPVRFSRHAASYTPVVAGSADEGILAQMSTLIRTHKVDIALPSGVRATRFLSRHRGALQEICAVAPVPDPETLELARSKGRLVEHMEATGIPHPRTILVREVTQALEFFETLDGPALLKPFLSAGGRGIIRIDTRDTLERWLVSGEASAPHLLQELIPGHDIDCSFLSLDGRILASTVQRGMLSGTSVYAAPAGVEFLTHPGALDTATALASSLRWTGVAHVDMRYDERDGLAKVLEINPRFWRSLLGSVAVGVNFPLLACQQGLGEPLPLPAAEHGRYVHESRVALRQMIRQRGRGRPYRFGETVLAEAIRDPMPELVLLLLRRFIPEAREG